MSHSHALLIDAGGIGGALLGMGAVAIIGGGGTRWTTYYKGMVPSTMLGGEVQKLTTDAGGDVWFAQLTSDSLGAFRPAGAPR